MRSKKSKKIAQIGSGFVGKAAGKGFTKLGNDVTFYDVKKDVMDSLNSDGFKARHISTLEKSAGKRSEEFDFIMVSVPTPTIDRHVQMGFLESALSDIGRYLSKAKKYAIVVVRSTVTPGTTEDFVIPHLESESGKKHGKDFGISMNPEFLREAKAEEDFSHPWITVIGADDEKTRVMLGELYSPFKSPMSYMSIREAEMTKYIHNLLNATKISFFNEMRIVNERMGLSSDREFKTAVKSAEAIWNPEYGIKDFGPYGGSCLPKDTQGFFTWALENLHLELPVLKGTIKTNEIIKMSRIPMCIGSGCKSLIHNA